MIIIEGPDGAGKSFLCRQIRERFGLSEGRRGTSDRSRLSEVTVPDAYASMKEAVTGHKRPFVWDRMFFSEFVYYPLTTGECQFSEGQRQHFLELFQALRCPIILCQPPVHVCLENVAGDHDPKHKKFNDALPEVYLAYVNVYKWMPSHTVLYDYTFEAPDRIYQIVDSYMTRRHAREW